MTTLASRKEILNRVRQLLLQQDEVVFAYVFGSFLKGPFRDIDIAVFVDEDCISDYLRFGLRLAAKIEREIHLPVDLRVLNDAPLYFQYATIKGEVLISNDEETRCRFVERVIVEYLDFREFERQVIREIIMGSQQLRRV